jgi:hypothetical protein
LAKLIGEETLLLKRCGNCRKRIPETNKKPLLGTGTGAQQKHNQDDSDEVVKHEEVQHVPQQAPDLACPNSVRLRANEINRAPHSGNRCEGKIGSTVKSY